MRPDRSEGTPQLGAAFADIELLVRYELRIQCEVLDAALVREWGGGLEGEDLRGVMDEVIAWWMSPAGPRRKLAVRDEHGEVRWIEPPPPSPAPAEPNARSVECSTCRTVVVPRDGCCPRCGVSFAHRAVDEPERQEIAFDTRLLTWPAKLLLVGCALFAFVVTVAGIVLVVANGWSVTLWKFVFVGMMLVPAVGSYWLGWWWLDRQGVKLRR
jgi:hypothetical protein